MYKQRINADKKFQLRRQIDMGLKAAVAQALEEHRRAGRPVAILREGRIVLTLPETRDPTGSWVLREEPSKP